MRFNIFSTPNWNEKQKFWAETIRTVILTGVGAITVILIVDPFKDLRAYKGEIDKEKLRIKSGIIEDFVVKSYLYTAWTSDICEGRPTKEEQDGFEKAYGDYTVAQNKIRVYFSESIKKRLDTLTQTAASIKRVTDIILKMKSAGALKATGDTCQLIREKLRFMNNELAQHTWQEIEAMNSDKKGASSTRFPFRFFFNITFTLSVVTSMAGAYLKATTPEGAKPLLVVGFLASIVFIIVAIYEVRTSEEAASIEKTIWTVLFMFFMFIITMLYIFIGRRKINQ